MKTTLSTTPGRRGRKAQHYLTAWGETVVGLYRKPSGVWRVRATGQEYTEPDERLAVARFYAVSPKAKRETISIPFAAATGPDQIREAFQESAPPPVIAEPIFFEPPDAPQRPLGNGPPIRIEQVEGSRTLEFFREPVAADAFWPWLRRLILDDPGLVAQRTGIAELARLSDLPKAQPSIKLAVLLATYQQHAECKAVSIRKAAFAWNEFVNLTGAVTLADLTTEKLIAYRDVIRGKGFDPDTVSSRFTKVKTVIKFGLTRGLDAGQIRAALDRASVLIAPKSVRSFTPHPIQRAEFAKLLTTAKDDATMEAVLLTALNLAMYGSEVLSIGWDELDLDKGTYVADKGRAKTKVVRVGVLWPRTIKALRKLQRTPGAVIKSSRGAAYHPNSLGKLFAKLRTEAKVPASVEFNTLRDGAYSAACCKEVPFHLAQILAGHRQGSQSDHYIARDPEMVRPAVEAIERAYFRRV